MKKSVIFWNIIAVLLYLLILIFGGDLFRFIVLAITSVIGLVAVVLNMSEEGISPLNIRALRINGFIFWFLLITPSYILSLLIDFIYRCVINFNKWLNK